MQVVHSKFCHFLRQVFSTFQQVSTYPISLYHYLWPHYIFYLADEIVVVMVFQIHGYRSKRCTLLALFVSVMEDKSLSLKLNWKFRC